MSAIEERLKIVKGNIAKACCRANRDPDYVRLVVVTKSAQPGEIEHVVKLGCTDLGESRVQHLRLIADQLNQDLEKSDNQRLVGQIRWHMIGHLQRNKVKHTLDLCHIIHSVDTLRLAEEIDTAAAKKHLHCSVLMQVNCSKEPQKYGVPVGAAIHLAEQIASMPHLRLEGLMTMAPLTMDKNIVHDCFIRCRELFEEIRAEKITGSRFCHLSMGMSQDYEIAVECGATLLRIGSAIFAG